jgi:transcriptional regulator GlxA family with amidase domain
MTWKSLARQWARQAKVTASVCTGVFLLAEAKVITEGNVTTHREDIPDLRKRYPHLIVHESRRWVDEGFVVTSGGISAGIDMSLHLVPKLYNIQLAEKTAIQMEYNGSNNLSKPSESSPAP